MLLWGNILRLPEPWSSSRLNCWTPFNQLSQLSGPVLAWLSGLVLFQACGYEPKSKETCKKWGRFLRIVISHLKSKCCLLLDTNAYSIHVTNTEFRRMNITLTSTDLLPVHFQSIRIWWPIEQAALEPLIISCTNQLHCICRVSQVRWRLASSASSNASQGYGNFECRNSPRFPYMHKWI